MSLNRKFLWLADIFITHVIWSTVFFNASNNIKNAMWLLTVEDSMIRFLCSWTKYKNKWHFLLFPKSQPYFFCLPHTDYTCRLSSSMAKEKSNICVSLWNQGGKLSRSNSLMLLNGWSKISHLDLGKKKARELQLFYKILTSPKKKKKRKRITDFSFLIALDHRTCQDFQ